MKRKRIITIAALLAIISLIVGANYTLDLFDDQVNRYPKVGLLSDFDDTGNYKINPDTILSSLEHGETGVFVPESPIPETHMPETPISWHQSDYLKIVSALHQFVWKETLDSWRLYNVEFDTTCRDDPNAFELGDFVFFKTVKDNGEIKYTTRELIIAPQNADVSWGGGANFPHPIFGWKSINLGQLQVSAEDALRIAEENGGKEFRLSIQNKCAILISMNKDAYNGWRVGYFPNDNGLSIIWKYIDPNTGKVIK